MLLFLGLGFAWGIPYMFIKVAGQELAPSVLVLGRTGLAAVLLLPVALSGRRRRADLVRTARRPLPLLAYTVVEVVGPWLFLTRAEQILSSSTAAILISAVPVVGALIALLTRRGDRLGTRGGSGLVLGTLGVSALVGLDLDLSDLGAVAEMSVVVVGYALGPMILARYLGDLPGTSVMALSVTASALIYLSAVLLGPGLPTRWPSPQVLVALAVLGALCTAAAFLMLFALIGELGPVRATTIVYVNPVVAVAVGAAFLGESISAWSVLGLGLVLVGSALVNGHTDEPGSPAPAVPASLDPFGQEPTRTGRPRADLGS